MRSPRSRHLDEQAGSQSVFVWKGKAEIDLQQRSTPAALDLVMRSAAQKRRWSLAVRRVKHANQRQSR
jgi:hypothetical protein